MPHDVLQFQRDFAAAISVPAEGALRVYRNRVLAGCIEALQSNYPVVDQIIGHEMFEVVASDFAEVHPPRSPILATYGEHFAEWIEEQSWAADLPYLADVARVERLRLESLFSADAEPLCPADLNGMADWHEVQLRLHTATRFDWLTTPGLSLWLAHQETLPSEVEPEWQHEGLLMTRPGMDVLVRPLSAAGHRFLFGIRMGESVGVAALATAGLYPDADPGALFASLVQTGAFAALRPEGSSDDE